MARWRLCIGLREVLNAFTVVAVYVSYAVARKEVRSQMVGNDFNNTLAMLCFLQTYLKELREETSMKAKNERERANPAAPAKPITAPREPWPKRRRFWHRSPAPQPRPRAESPSAVTDELLIATLR